MMSRAVELVLATGFDNVVEQVFPTGAIPVDKVAGAMASLLGTYCLNLPPPDRILLISETVESILKLFRDNHDHDLLLN